MSYYTRMSDTVQRGEWQCKCGCINEDYDRRCWCCRCDQDGNPPEPNE